MKKKQSKGSWFASFWVKAVLVPVVVMPIIVFSWRNIREIWAGPETDKKLEKKVDAIATDIDQQQETLDTLKDMYKEQHLEAEAQKKIDAAQLEALKSIVESNRKK